MSGKRKDVFSEAIVGVFMLAILAVLIYFTVIISGVDVLRGDRKVFASVTFDQVGGLKDRDNVMYRGTKVGLVDDVVVTPSNLLVRIEIDRAVVLRRGYRIAVCNLSMLGGSYLLLEEGTGDVLDLETTVFRGETPTDWMQDVSKIARNLRELTSKPEFDAIVTNLEVTSEKAKVIAERLERGEGTLGKLLSDDDAIYNDFKKTLAGATEVVDRIKRGEGAVGKLLSDDETLYNDLKDGVAAFKKTCEGADVKDTVEAAKKLLVNLNAVAEKMKNGEGTLGKLVNDDGLYNEVDGAIRDARQVLDNYRDTTPISTFTSLIGGAL